MLISSMSPEDQLEVLSFYMKYFIDFKVTHIKFKWKVTSSSYLAQAIVGFDKALRIGFDANAKGLAQITIEKREPLDFDFILTQVEALGKNNVIMALQQTINNLPKQLEQWERY